MQPPFRPALLTARKTRRDPQRDAQPSEVPVISVLPFPPVVDGHQPWPAAHVTSASDRAVLARAATLVGLPADHLPLPLRCGPGPAQLAVPRTTAELLLARLEETSGACPACACRRTTSRVAPRTT